jgi:MFS family permease
VVIPVTGFLIRRFRTRSLFGAAMGLFSAGTLLAALAPGFPVLLAARVVQAGGTAIMMPLLMTTVMTLVPPARRGVMMGNISIVIAVAPAIGPAVSGLVLSLLGWRFLFWLVLPIALAALVLGLQQVTDVGEPEPMRIDVGSVVLSALGFGGLVYGLSSFGQPGGSTAITSRCAASAGTTGSHERREKPCPSSRTRGSPLPVRSKARREVPVRGQSRCTGETVIALLGSRAGRPTCGAMPLCVVWHADCEPPHRRFGVTEAA